MKKMNELTENERHENRALIEKVLEKSVTSISYNIVAMLSRALAITMRGIHKKPKPPSRKPKSNHCVPIYADDGRSARVVYKTNPKQFKENVAEIDWYRFGPHIQRVQPVDVTKVTGKDAVNKLVLEKIVNEANRAVNMSQRRTDENVPVACNSFTLTNDRKQAIFRFPDVRKTEILLHVMIMVCIILLPCLVL